VIPVRLKVQNFLCYRDPAVLDFTRFRFACLSGDNGAGKSALLDAITWALWGRARARTADELIHLNQTEMEVEFEFRLGPNQYRVIRRRNRSGRSGTSVLDLQVLTPGGYRSIAGNSVRETEEQIRKLLRLDYETFINSAFILQNRADEFTRKTPSERKEVLAEILGLSLYEDLARLARDRARQAADRVKLLDAQARELEADVARAPDYRRTLEEVEAELRVVQAQLEELEGVLAEVHRLEVEAGRLSACQRDIDRWVVHLRAQRDRLTQASEQRRQDLERVRDLLSRAEEIEAGFTRWEALRREKDRYDALLRELAHLQDAERRLEAGLRNDLQRVERDRSGLLERLRTLREQAAQVPELEERLERLQADRDALEAELALKLGEKRRLVEETQHAISELKAQQANINRQLEDLRRRYEMLRLGTDRCPVCNAPLSPEDRDRLEAQCVEEGLELKRQLQTAQEAARAREAELQRLRQELEQAERDRQRQVEQVNRELGQIEANLRRSRQAAAEISAIQAEVEGLSELAAAIERVLAFDGPEVDPETKAAGQTLRRRPETHKTAAELVKVRIRRRSLGYDGQRHHQVTAELEALQAYPVLKDRLDHARADLPRIEAELADLERQLKENEARLAEQNERLAEVEAQRAALARQIPRVPEFCPRLPEPPVPLELEEALRRVKREADGCLEQKSARRRELDTRRGSLRQLLEDCGRKAAELERVRAERQQTAEEQGLYEELARAFGKKGVPAMVIEAAIPEIQDEANRLLEQMTDNRMHIQISTQRPTQSGDGTIETLDITISDEFGTRNYELYSGGEAFRINLAIRIALSRLLARRAGAQLNMLVIDEGFGSQDSVARERLVETIASIAHEFEKLLVITHLPDLKDRFPVRVEITRGEGGSRITVV